MKRRSFLKTTTAFGLPVIIHGTSMMALPKSRLFSGVSDDTDRVLVLIQLNGGNDSLNTMIPMESYDNLVKVRPTIVLPDHALLDLSATNKLHPSMVELAERYQQGMVKIIQSVGYPNQNRSHFRSTDIWVTASDADEIIDTGWVGRYFDQLAPSYPQGYPNEDYPDPFAMTIGNFVSATCQGNTANYSLAIRNANADLNLSGGIGETPMDGSKYAEELDFLKTAIRQTNAYGAVIQEAADKGNNLAVYPEDRLANQLKSVARLISGGLKTKVYIVSLGGFDTHANQVDVADPTKGRHANLLKSLSGAIHAFLEDLELLGLEERVVGMTFSEFGRRIGSNLSSGTDHGSASLQMVFGSCVRGGIEGDDPVIPEQVEPGDGLPMQFDFRSVYGSILMDWFGVSENTIKDLLFEDFQHLSLIEGCSITSTVDPISPSLSVYNFPNPFSSQTYVVFELAERLPVKLSVFDTVGKELVVALRKTLPKGRHEIAIDGSGWAPGTYYYRVQAGNTQKVGAMIKY